MKILFAATPVRGHVNPVLAIARLARERGDDVLFATSAAFAPAVEAIGGRFVPLGAGADLDLRDLNRAFPERALLPPGPAQLRFDMERIFLDTMAPQAETLRAVVAAEAPDAIVADNFFCGTTPLFLDATRRKTLAVIDRLAAARDDQKAA